MCGENSSQEGPGCCITRPLSEARGTFIAWEACRLQLTWLWQVSGRAWWWGAASQGSGCQVGNEGGGSWGGGVTVLKLTLLRQEGDPVARGAACFPASQGQCGLRCPHLRLCLTSPMFGHPLSTPSFLKPSPLSLDPLSASLFLWKLQIIFHWGQPLSPRLPSCRYGAETLGQLTQVWPGDPVSQDDPIRSKPGTSVGNFCWTLGMEKFLSGLENLCESEATGKGRRVKRWLEMSF